MFRVAKCAKISPNISVRIKRCGSRKLEEIFLFWSILMLVWRGNPTLEGHQTTWRRLPDQSKIMSRGNSERSAPVWTSCKEKCLVSLAALRPPCSLIRTEPRIRKAIIVSERRKPFQICYFLSQLYHRNYSSFTLCVVLNSTHSGYLKL